MLMVSSKQVTNIDKIPLNSESRECENDCENANLSCILECEQG